MHIQEGKASLKMRDLKLKSTKSGLRHQKLLVLIVFPQKHICVVIIFSYHGNKYRPNTHKERRLHVLRTTNIDLM